MKNLPEGAGSPISRMPQKKTKGGLQPTHQPIFPEYHKNPERSSPNEERQQKRLHHKLTKKSIIIPRQTHSPIRPEAAKLLIARAKTLQPSFLNSALGGGLIYGYLDDHLTRLQAILLLQRLSKFGLVEGFKRTPSHFGESAIKFVECEGEKR